MKNSVENTVKSSAPSGCEDCGVTEKQFPLIGKCCRQLSGPGGPDYEKICSFCAIWKSSPDPKSLEIAVIFDCRSYGYAKRVKN